MKGRSLNTALKMIFSTEAIAPFVIASLCLSITASAIYGLLIKWIGDSANGLVSIAIGAAMIMVLTTIFLVNVIKKRLKLKCPSTGERSPAKHKGIIFLVGRKEACVAAVKHHQPVLEHIWLVYSPMTTSVALELEDILEDKSINVKLKPIENAFSLLQVRDMVDAILTSELPDGILEEDVISDFTGMTALASVGTVLACLSPNRKLQYTPAIQDKNGNPSGESGEPIEVVLTWDNALEKPTEEVPEAVGKA